MKGLRRRHGLAKRDPATEKADLRAFVRAWHAAVDGSGPPMDKFKSHEFAKLAWKYKYAPEFQDEMIVRHAGKPGRAPSREDMPVMSNRVRIPGRVD